GTQISLDVKADVTLGRDPAGGLKLTGIVLTVRGEVEGIDADAFQQAAQAAKGGCPISKALAAVDITRDGTLAQEMAPASFAAVSALVPDSPGRFTGAVHPGWTIAGKPNGGYLLAMLGRAATAVAPQEHVIAASAHYLHSPEPGPVVVEAEVLRA